jgi:hypothetical protein
MSYILDSLKKSENDRKTTDNVSAISIQSPEFLKNDKPERPSYIKIGFALFVLIILALIVYFFVFNKPLKSTVLLNDSVNTESSISFENNNTKANLQERKIEESENINRQITNDVSNSVIQEQQNVKSINEISKEESLDNSLAKEKANTVALYQKAIEDKKRSEVDSFYKQLSNNQAEIKPQVTPSVPTANTDLDKKLIQENVIQENIASSSNETEITAAEEEPTIKTIYELDPVFKRSIPIVNYGAHIYASDNKSGFVILNGARRRVGDQLDNGIYIEKIRSEDVVLSYNGSVFSLPAMKNWEGY